MSSPAVIEAAVPEQGSQVQRELAPKSEICPADRWIALLCAVIGIAYLSLFVRNLGNVDSDEGIVLQGAVRILEGQVPYKDFFTFVAPGSYYWMALLFRVFGTSVIVARGCMACYAGIFAACTYLLSRRLFSRNSALFCTFISIYAVMPLRFFVLHNWDSAAVGLLALYSAVVWVETKSPRWLVLCGMLTALTIMAEQSKGAGLLLGLAIALAVVGWKRTRKTIWRDGCVFSVALLLPLGILVAYLGSQHALGAMIEQLLWPMHHYSGVNHMPYGFIPVLNEDWAMLFSGNPVTIGISVVVLLGPSLLIASLPLVILVCGVRWLWSSDASPAKKDLVIVSLSVLAASLLALKATGRPELHHIVFISPMFLFLTPIVVEEKASAILSRMKPLLATYLFVSVALIGTAMFWPRLNVGKTVHTPRGTVHVWLPNDGLDYLTTHVHPGTRVLVHPYQPLHEFLMGARSVGRYDFLQAGMHTREQFDELAQQVAADPPPYAVMDLNFSMVIPRVWVVTRVGDLAYDPVADYVASHYRACATLHENLWTLVFYARKDLACPDSFERR